MQFQAKQFTYRRAFSPVVYARGGDIVPYDTGLGQQQKAPAQTQQQYKAPAAPQQKAPAAPQQQQPSTGGSGGAGVTYPQYTGGNGGRQSQNPVCPQSVSWWWIPLGCAGIVQFFSWLVSRR